MGKSTLAAAVTVALACAASRPAGAAQPQPTTLEFRSALGEPFELVRVRAWVDGRQVYDGARPFDLPLAPGEHAVALEADYRLSDPVFTYMRGYRVVLTSRERVRSTLADPPTVARARAVETGGATTPIERRAEIVWR